MPSYYILNSAVITAPGTYKYDLTTPSGARAWLLSHTWVSCIGYEETAKALSELTSFSGKYPPISIPVNRLVVKMQCEENPNWEEEGVFYRCDEALVFRLVFPSRYRPDPAQKGRLGEEFIRENCEIGILRRIE